MIVYLDTSALVKLYIEEEGSDILERVVEEADFLAVSNNVLGDGPGILGAPDNVVGEFSLDDMVRHLGLFTFYLEENQSKYNLDHDRVFYSGGSAGGHLSTAVTIAISKGSHSEIFSANITVN